MECSLYFGNFGEIYFKARNRGRPGTRSNLHVSLLNGVVILSAWEDDPKNPIHTRHRQWCELVTDVQQVHQAQVALQDPDPVPAILNVMAYNGYPSWCVRDFMLDDM